MAKERSKAVLNAIIAGVLLAAAPAAAAPNCSISATPVAFGTYDVFATGPTDSIGAITYRCTGMGNSNAVTIDIDGGWFGAVAQRRMARLFWFGLEYLPYNLYLDAARTTVWGNGTTAEHYGPIVPPNGKDVSVTIFGRIPPRQDVSAGNYFDTVTVTINF